MNNQTSYPQFYIQCGDCMAHYPNGTLHICDQLMKDLVEKKRKQESHDISRYCDCPECKNWFSRHSLPPKKTDI